MPARAGWPRAGWLRADLPAGIFLQGLLSFPMLGARQGGMALHKPRRQAVHEDAHLRGESPRPAPASLAALDSLERDEGSREAALARALGSEAQLQETGELAVMLAGRRGSGRTVLAHALCGQDAVRGREGGVAAEAGSGGNLAFRHGGQTIVLLAPRGFGGAEDHGECLRNMLDTAAQAHAVLLCVPCPDRAWALEESFLGRLAEAAPEAPLFCAGTKLDLLPPARIWKPERMHLAQPQSAKERACVRWQADLAALLRRAWKDLAPERVHLVSAGAGDGEGAFGIARLKACLASAAPCLLQSRSFRGAGAAPDRRTQAERIVLKAAVTAAAGALVPIPFAEAAFLAPLQIRMCASLANLYGAELGKGTAARLLAPALAGFLGRIGLVSLLDFVPGPGSVAGTLMAAGIAGPATLAVGEALADCYERGEFQPGTAEMTRLVKERYRTALQRKAEILTLASVARDGGAAGAPAQAQQAGGGRA